MSIRRFLMPATGFAVLAGWLLSGLLFPSVRSPAARAAGDLFFSEYVEGSSNNKALEIYNPTDSPIDLAALNYDVQFYFNGNTTPQTTIPLTGVLPPGEVFILADDGADPAIIALADQLYSGSFFNGDDAVVLRRDGTILDVIGQIGDDPGTGWGSGDTRTNNHTLRRKPHVLTGDANPSDPFDPALEWDGFPQDSFDGLGSHAVDQSTPTATPTEIPTPTATPLPPTAEPSPTPLPTPSPAPTPTPSPTPLPTPYPALLISELLYDGLTPTTEGDEFVEICNPNPIPVDPTGYRVGDAATRGDREGMYFLPANAPLPPDGCLVIARDAGQFQARFGFAPDADFAGLTRDSVWGRGQWSLANSGDEVVLLAPDDTLVDSAAYRQGDYAAVGVLPEATAPEPDSLQRVWPTDLNSMPDDFIRAAPNPGTLTLVPAPPDPPPVSADLPLGMHAYWGHLHAHTTLSDGAGPPGYAFAAARAAGLHFYALTDHAWWLTDTEWQNLLAAADQADTPGQFVALTGVEWSHPFSGHINLFGIDSPVRHNDPQFDTLDRLYAWLAQNPAVVAQFNHPDRDYDGNFNEFAFDASAAASITLQEIGNHAQDYMTYETAFVQSNLAGWRVAPTNNGDTHTASWGTDTPGRTGVVAAALTRSDILAALKARRVFSTEDSNLALALRAGEVWMGSELSAAGPLSLSVFFADPDAEPLTLTLFDGALPLDSAAFTVPSGEWTVDVEARPGHFFWVRAVQGDGHRAWSAPLWIAGQPEPEPLQFSELLPAPGDWDWTGDGQTDQSDEWLELYNPLSRPVGLGGWRLVDGSGVTYQFPLGTVISPTGYLVLPHDETGISLNNSGDTLRLVHPNGKVVDTFAYTSAPRYDETWCRLPDGRWSDSCGPSPGEPNWELPPPSPLQVNIFQARRLAYGAWLRVKGTVTAPPGVFGERVMYIQDDSSGIRVYLPANHGLSFVPGDRVEVEGHLKTYYGEWEIDVDEAGDVSLLGPGDPLPPLPIATTNMLEPYEGLLVMLTGRAVRFSGRSVFWVDDGTDPAKVYLAPASGVKKPFIEPESPVTVVGIVSQHTTGNEPTREDYRLMPRFQTDLLLPQVSPPPGWPTTLPETGYQ